MKAIGFLIIVQTCSSTIKEIYGFKIYGAVNISNIFDKAYKKGIGNFTNKLPDMTYNDYPKARWPGITAHVSRRFLKDILAGRRKLIQLNDQDVALLNNADYSRNIANSVKRIIAHNYRKNDLLNLIDKIKRKFLILLSDNRKLNQISRLESPSVLYNVDNLKNTEKDIKKITAFSSRRADIPKLEEENRNANLLNAQQAHKLQEIRDFLDWHYPATDYIYDEINRIKETREVVDRLRYMINYLGQPNKDQLRSSIFNCLKERRKIDVPPQDIWKQRLTNTLIIHPVRDPYEPDPPNVS